MARTRNTRLAEVIRETGWPQTQVATHFLRVAAKAGADELLTVSRSHVSMWVGGTRPEGRAVAVLYETFSRKLGRVVTPAQIGLAPVEEEQRTGSWDIGTLTALSELGGTQMDIARRRLLKTSAYSAVGTALPPDTWWDQALTDAQARQPLSRDRVTGAHVEAVRDAHAHYSRGDQLLGGRAGRSALTAYLHTDVADYLAARIPSEQLRKDLMSGAGELAYLVGWMSFDSAEHGRAQHYFRLALRMAAEADDAPLAGHILRAMSHQAADLGHSRDAVNLASASVERKRYTAAGPRERALIGVVHARALAADGQRRAAVAALRRAEDDLTAADPAAGAEPQRVFFFGEASLASQTAHTLTALGDLDGAGRQFTRSVRTRRAQTFRRTHSVTLGYLGAVQVKQGALDAAIGTWTEALDAMEGVHSGRATETVVQMRRALSPFRHRGNQAAGALDDRARTLLRRTG
ncbi:Tat pathway signal protein [Streptomyces uncialis]|uniref:Tat pathway signal protein n=1 Tax=Streptomyces uncialis TaxID=1048205 RepID=UPI003867A33F|nr:Tat pathway signal protein [Streptomyces uncialis]